MRAIHALIALAACWALVVSAAAEPADMSFDPATGYRIAHYRAAVPDSVPGGTRVDRDRVDALIKDGAILLDVMPSEGAGADPISGKWRLSRPHQSIPGAIWLPDVGRGQLKDGLEKYLQSNVAKLTSEDRSKALIVFCQSDCWMGWNAVQRISKFGYTNIFWFPEGTDGWVEWGDRKLVPAMPIPLDPAAPAAAR